MGHEERREPSEEPDPASKYEGCHEIGREMVGEESSRDVEGGSVKCGDPVSVKDKTEKT